METVAQNNKRRNENIHSITELEVAGNTIVTLRERDGYLLMKREDTYTSYRAIKLANVTYWTPTNSYVR